MVPIHTIGFVWPGPPVPGDAEEVARFIPDGVSWHIVGAPRDFANDDRPAITRDRLFAMAENPNIEAAAATLPGLGVQAIGYGCTSASYVRGVGGDTDISARITESTHLPSTTTSTTAVEALRLLGVTRVAVLSPHVDELNERLRGFLEGHGLDVVHMRGLNKLRGIEQIPQEEIYELVVQLVDRPEADGIFISCTGMRTSNILAGLEEATGKPVVSALQATIWGTLRLADAPADLPGLGSLFQAPVAAPV
ncbi:MAG: aspartate/glutamate racemase family protein [Chloroflexota bacterium]|nr:aspartate/glutamate racemase family protein [Chloroflexota bacterium]